MKRVIVVGGGASGMMAAISAARQGAKVTLLEKNRQTGKKLLATGNGRCNFSNRNQELSNYRCQDPAFVEEALKVFSVEEAVDFFEELGLLTRERQGYLYPNSGQAASVAGALRLEALRLQVKLCCDTEAQEAEKKGDVFRVHTPGWVYEGEALILACGSRAAPETGSSGDGYRFAAGFGHRVEEPLPALTGLYAWEKDCGRLSGVRQDAKVLLTADGAPLAEAEGEVQFASYGLSGIPVFQVSRYAARALRDGRKCRILLDFLPGYTEGELAGLLQKKQEFTGERKGTDVLLGMLPEKLLGVLLERAGISLKKKGRDWTEAELFHLAKQMKQMGFTIGKCRGYEQAQVCTGGVPLFELSGISMESRLVPGLYLAGELLDVDGACGGYNLQWAWTSGFLAGRSAALL